MYRSYQKHLSNPKEHDRVYKQVGQRHLPPRLHEAQFDVSKCELGPGAHQRVENERDWEAVVAESGVANFNMRGQRVKLLELEHWQCPVYYSLWFYCLQDQPRQSVLVYAALLYCGKKERWGRPRPAEHIDAKKNQILAANTSTLIESKVASFDNIKDLNNSTNDESISFRCIQRRSKICLFSSFQCLCWKNILTSNRRNKDITCPNNWSIYIANSNNGNELFNYATYWNWRTRLRYSKTERFYRNLLKL